MIDVIKAGLQTTVQDSGRFGFRHLGFNQCGALDKPALLLANRLVKNPDHSAVLEISLGNSAFKFKQTCLIAVTGAEFHASIDDKPLWSGWRNTIKAGQTLTFKSGQHGMHTYLAIAGGIDVTPIQGSASTDISAAFGGFKGRALQKGDQLNINTPSNLTDLSKLPAIGIQQPKWDNQIRVLTGPQWHCFSTQSQKDFCHSPWQVSNHCNRMGARLMGKPLKLTNTLELASHAVMPGVIQVPACGEPIALMADAQTTGGYPIIAVVIDTDLWKIAQSQPGKHLTFKTIDYQHAKQAQEHWQHYLYQVQKGISNHG